MENTKFTWVLGRFPLFLSVPDSTKLIFSIFRRNEIYYRRDFIFSFLSRWHSPLFLTTSVAVFPLLSVEFWLAPLINSKSMILFSPEMVKVIQFSFYSYKFVFSKINFEVYHYQQHNVAPCGHFYQPMLSKFFQNKIEWKVQYVNAVSNWKLYLHLHHF